MKLKHLFIVSISSFLAFACSDKIKQERDQMPSGLLSNSKSVKLPLDERSTYEFFNFQVRNDTLIVLNQPNSSLDFYNLNSQEFFNRILIPVDGESGVQKLYSFFYHNLDTVFVFSQFKINQIKIFDFDGDYQSTISLNRSDLGTHGILNHASLPSMPTYYFNQKLFFQVMPAFEDEMLNDSFINEYVYDIYRRVVLPDSTIKKPKSLHNTPAFTYGVNRVKLNADETIYSWKHSDSIYHISDRKNGGNSLAPLFFGNQDLIAVGKGKKMSEKEAREIDINSHHYGKIIVDTDKGLIHRVKYLPLEENVSGNPYLIRDFEIITGEKNGNLIGSTVFKGGKYDPRVLFFGPGGIYLPKINPNYEGLVEEFIEYDVFQILD